MDELSAETPLSKTYEPSKLALYLTDESQGDHNGHTWQILFEAKVINDYWLENKHDYIQWWFPLDEPSRAKSLLGLTSSAILFTGDSWSLDILTELVSGTVRTVGEGSCALRLIPASRLQLPRSQKACA